MKTITIKKKNFNYYCGKKYDGMMGRCYRPSDRSYPKYGAAGIKVCSLWAKDINEFRCWLVKELNVLDISTSEFVENSKKYQLDRINPNGDYSPDNCRIVNAQTNVRNRQLTKGKQIISSEGEIIVFGD